MALRKNIQCQSEGDLNFHGYYNPDMTSNVDRQKSTNGYIFSLAGRERESSWSS